MVSSPRPGENPLNTRGGEGRGGGAHLPARSSVSRCLRGSIPIVSRSTSAWGRWSQVNTPDSHYGRERGRDGRESRWGNVPHGSPTLQIPAFGDWRDDLPVGTEPDPPNTCFSETGGTTSRSGRSPTLQIPAFRRLRDDLRAREMVNKAVRSSAPQMNGQLSGSVFLADGGDGDG